MTPDLTGRTIRVVAPARWTKPEALARFSELMTGFGANVEIDSRCALREGQLAGPDQARAAALNTALTDPSVDVVWAARGGYGSGRLLGAINWNAATKPKILIGHSDITILHQQALRAGVIPILGAMPGESLDEARVENVVAAAALAAQILRNGAPPAQKFDLPAVHAGSASGELIAGNLHVLTRLIGTPYEPDWRPCVLCLEDTGEYVYALDRMFLHLKQSRLAQRIKGIVLGEFFNNFDSDVPWGETVDQMAAHHFPNIPIAMGLDFGHGLKNLPLVLGQGATLEVGDARAVISLK
jgi:muramoyltetrapeptide carboxypeptidase